MPQIMIPPLGSVIQLEEDWRFKLYNEHRNEKLIEAAGEFPPFRSGGLSQYNLSWRELEHHERQAAIAASVWDYAKPEGMDDDSPNNFWTGDWTRDFIFRAGTELKISRIYIRRGLKGFDSVTFSTKQWLSAPGDPLWGASRKLRSLSFWAKLSDVNQIVGRYISD